MKRILISSQFGHEIMALNFAKAFGAEVVIVPKKDEQDAYEAEARKIYDNMSFFYPKMRIVPFTERINVEAEDIIGSLKAGTLHNSVWDIFAGCGLTPNEDTDELPEYPGLSDKRNILFVPQKLVSDGECGISAEQQSLPLAVFDFLKEETGANLVLGQHFHKVNDLEKVQKLADAFRLYVPGMDEHPEVFGIRGVQHKMYYNMYAQLAGSVGIAGTHTWFMLTMFPWIPQVILFNNHGVERWKAIEKAYRKRGYNIRCIGFDENSSLKQLAKEIKKAFAQL